MKDKAIHPDPHVAAVPALPATAAHSAVVNLERRAKRQAWAPVHELFAVTAPGLEPLCAAELKAIGAEEVQPLAGGVAFAGRLDLLYAANLWLSTAGRVLLRLKDFRVRTWEDLVRQAAAIPWEVWLPAGCGLKVQASLHQSNLRHEGRIAEEVFGAAAAHLGGLGLAPPCLAEADQAGVQNVQVRGTDRRATISLDSSGEHLHRRGYRLAPGPAPLREDLAAALLLLAGYTGEEPLLDAFCGSGTLAIEAGLAARRLAPGRGRAFACQAWPSFREPTWRHQLRLAADQALAAPPAAIIARDTAVAALDICQENAGRAGLGGQIAIERADFFKAAPPESGPGLVVINPPYGKRLGSVRQAGELVERIGRRLAEAYAGWRVGIALYRPEWAESLPLADARSLTAPHGGLKLTLLTGRVAA
ncbi:MAG: RNA methyltransferase [Pseudomonadota bacterium]